MQATIREVAEWSGASSIIGLTNDGERLVLSGVSTDTRRIAPGQLFVPLRGDRFDGHDYVRAARDAGASAALWDGGVRVPNGIDLPLVIVDDTLAALQALAVGYLRTLEAKIVAVTGSNGKTTTKDLISSVLSTEFRVHKTEGNYNNHIGLPLTVLSAPKHTQALVLELGMSGEGEISLLSSLGTPDIAVVTNVGESHLLQLGSRRNIARAKLEIVDGLKPGGTLVYYGDEPLLVEELAAKPLIKTIRTVTFGENTGNDWIARYIRANAESTKFTIGGTMGADEEEKAFELPVPGRHNAVNALAAIAVGRLFGLSFAAIGEGLKSVKLTGMRIERSAAKNGAVILNDAYNASPTSVRAAINLVAELSGYRRKWIVLGDMLELGPNEAEMHAEIGSYLNETKADEVLFYGPLSNDTYRAALANFAAGRARYFTDKEALADELLDRLDTDDLVLVKASRGMKMEEIVTILQKGARG
ncbi:UDP-N-acetylmuramoyl-tripeptide--D-alanyl-D-alanine ligase [Cohnella endophytica]|uniref:UDP-N-acetylmuramoyl-tripeptide--D-alanyl-D-alanine ligase n=2 Tax=Cohnella endophytica TaxID=2419778 RepID=A0A494XXG2_9BACL|nr:UDP-N-acetylmuramoyl-tripeptide--D-alanyl-D-alanine ligase [Cohnella endophytica]RKP55267.1 UDP-N-acetylmuramoyl-tripeptide--D-alanyl-D-alanine ligase [Cohnella endophytica]